MVSLAADAVSVGSDHILNCFLWHPVQKKAVHLPPQVQKILKTYDLLENEGALWTGRTKEFMKKRADEDKDKKQRRLRVKTDTREQVPTYQWMQCVQTALRTAGLKFQDFAEIAVASEAEPVQVPRVLLVCTDQESLQITAMNFLKNYRRLAILHCYDPMHRRQNDTILALGEVVA
eukprot:s2009_g20.t1